MGKPKWTREEIIRRILDLDAKGYPLTVGKPGVSPALYQAGSRIFGSWRNALQAAGQGRRYGASLSQRQAIPA